jgi:hypothetical protein
VTTKSASRIDRLERLIHGLEQDAVRILQRIERLEGILFRLVGALAHADQDVRELMVSRPDLITDQLELWRDWAVGVGNAVTNPPENPGIRTRINSGSGDASREPSQIT